MSFLEARGGGRRVSIPSTLSCLALACGLVAGAGPAPADASSLELVQRCYGESDLCAEGLADLLVVGSRLGLDVHAEAETLDFHWLSDHGVGDVLAIEARWGGRHVATLSGPRSQAALRAELAALETALSLGGLPSPESLLEADSAGSEVPGLVISQRLRYVEGAFEPGEITLLAGAAPKIPPPGVHDYIVQTVAADGSVLDARSWEPGRMIVPPPPRPGEDPGGVFYPEVVDTAFLAPYFREAAEIRLFQPYGVPARSFELDRDRLAARAFELGDAVPTKKATRVHGRGDAAEKLVVVFVGDRYGKRAKERRKWKQDVRAHTDFMFEEPTLRRKKLRKNFIVYRADKRNGMDCEYGCADIDRLICCSGFQVTRAASRSGVAWDEIIVLVDSKKYGGSGGSYAVAYSSWKGGDWGRHVTVHEIGHSIFRVMDEYEYGREGSAWGPNCSADCDWKGPGVGCWEGCSYEGLNRPTERHCLMRTLTPADGYKLCPVCAKQTKKVVRRY